MSRGKFQTSRTSYPADGTSAGRIDFIPGIFDRTEKLEIPTNNPSVQILSHNLSGGLQTIYFKSTRQPGIVLFATNRGTQIKITFFGDDIASDRDEDGFPDLAELKNEKDKAAFRSWFVRIAESQFVKRSAGWNHGERDCSGLIRFAYREALKQHDEQWHQRSGIGLDKNIPDVTSYNYPEVPVIGENIFRIDSQEVVPSNIGSIHPDSKTQFSVFADASALIRFQTFLVSRDIRDALPGDLIFFQIPDNPDSPHHSMIVVKSVNFSASENIKDTLILIYHTGEDNIMKRVKASYLEKSLTFRADPSNPSFLGVYRFHILD